jgi:hypothetical protein
MGDLWQRGVLSESIEFLSETSFIDNGESGECFCSLTDVKAPHCKRFPGLMRRTVRRFDRRAVKWQPSDGTALNVRLWSSDNPTKRKLTWGSGVREWRNGRPMKGNWWEYRDNLPKMEVETWMSWWPAESELEREMCFDVFWCVVNVVGVVWGGKWLVVLSWNVKWNNVPEAEPNVRWTSKAQTPRRQVRV